jgi:hemerythrin superfamily protein
MTKVLLKEIRRQHRCEHAALDSALRGALAVTDDFDARPLQGAWTVFERTLARHLELEEESLFPLVEGAHPESIQKLRDDHRLIRALVAEIGLGCDLHTVQRARIDALVKLLSEHAAREDATLDRWLDEEIPSDTRRHLGSLFVDMIRAELRPVEERPSGAPPG